MFINIYSKGKYPANELSNFAPHRFSLDGVDLPSMEAFLQSLKFEDERSRQQVMAMSAKEAKEAGSKQKWNTYLFWKGERINRFSPEYTQLITRAYRQLLCNENFKTALAASKGKILLHTIGRTFRRNTVLTWWEFTRILTKLRKEVLDVKT